MKMQRKFMIKIREIDNQKVWDTFVDANNSDTFLQSWSWGEFNKSLGNEIWRLGLDYHDSLKATCLAIKITAKRGSFIFVPHGPIIDKALVDVNPNTNSLRILREVLEAFKKELVKLTIGNNCSFIRIAPILENRQEYKDVFKYLGLIEAPIHVHSELSWILDITSTEEELLHYMRKTTRYLIRQKDKLEIITKLSTNIDDLKIFYPIYKETEKRQKFTAYSLDYLKKEFQTFAARNQVFLTFAYYNKEAVAAAFTVLSTSSGFNHHTASILKYPKLPASYCVQWEIIKELKRRGLIFYNFWGIASEDKPNHPWQGITTFKKGFGGFAKEYLHTKDFPLKWTYWANWVIETVRRIKRNY